MRNSKLIVLTISVVNLLRGIFSREHAALRNERTTTIQKWKSLWRSAAKKLNANVLTKMANLALLLQLSFLFTSFARGTAHLLFLYIIYILYIYIYKSAEHQTPKSEIYRKDTSWSRSVDVFPPPSGNTSLSLAESKRKRDETKRDTMSLRYHGARYRIIKD